MSHPLFDLSGQKALITGGGRGIGLTLATGLAQAGADVALADIDFSQVEEGQREIEALGRKCTLIEADVTDVASVDRMVSEAAAALGGLTILVNNAGTNVRRKLEEVTEADWDRVLDLNLKSLFFITRRAGEEMKKAGGGKVVNMASLMALSVFRNPRGQTYGPYSSSKGGVISLTRSFAVDWAKENIQVNCICPNFIDTPLTQPLKEDPVINDAICGRTPMGRFGRMGELVGPCVFLASAASNLVTGASLMVDGGWYSS
ncbi:MAG: glucose 1-dehydrogenase [Nitrospinaceae bacterium]|jgi:NAD(P)-dependent dehydrogenase (short-subunit alcohol dehydrogenase family)|nr:glucose 1-dehydrogenase [Nitrospinaceae bacterium]MBT3435860.1 glucose 1-dehydrogenase [Nitrospinaceae bacterium]MBT3821319.1 glucose 1-dehydrogenase [Nitrospinaceae bacterium]MBT4093956.1 glucose 1-dehydrogenase [Nitrospinaceae bacterium]MBT4431816.1 glucose 1-dehydrogenase [Nitrospinaceae bacterium]